jgi:zinc finger protein
MFGISTSAVERNLKLYVEGKLDLNREVLKSDVASISIPQAGVELVPGTLGGKFTTVEGLVPDIINHLGKENPFTQGDSSEAEINERVNQVVEKLQLIVDGKLNFTLILDDALANSFIQKYNDEDPKPIVHGYERTDEQNEFLGLKDLTTTEFETV